MRAGTSSSIGRLGCHADWASSIAGAVLAAALLAAGCGDFLREPDDTDDQGCVVHTDCQGGWQCVDGQCVPIEEDEPSCVTSWDCNPGYVCVDEECEPKPVEGCKTDDDCAEGEECHVSSGVCMPGSGVPPENGEEEDDPCDPNPCAGMPGSNEICTPDGDDYSCACLPGRVWYEMECHPTTREVDCINSKPENSSWTEDYEGGSLTQTWDGETFVPPADTCEWECDQGNPTEDGKCHGSTRDGQECTGLPDNASWNTAEEITQTWTGWEWEPPTTGVHETTPSTEDCRFKCDDTFFWQEDECAAISREVDCANTKPQNSSWTAEYEGGKLAQEWDGESFQPPDDTCQWDCEEGYHTDGESCVSNTRHGRPCTDLPENASWNTTDAITQTWDGSAWVPSTVGSHDTTPSEEECRFKCNDFFAWDDADCALCNLDAECGADCSPCPAETPRCKTAAGNTSECVECIKDPDCAAPTPVCLNNACIECIVHADCPDGGLCDSNECIDNPCLPNPCIHGQPVVRLDIEEGAGASLEDSSGNGNDGNVEGGSWTSEGKYGYALELGGAQHGISWSYAKPQNSFTLEAWVKAEESHDIHDESTSGTAGTTGQRYLFRSGHEGSSNAGAGVSVGTNGISVYEHGDGYMPALAVHEEELGTGWNHIVVTYENKTPRIYLNGSLARTGLTSPRSNVLAPNRIGCDAYGSFAGVVDRVRVYDYTLSDEEVFEAYANREDCYLGASLDEYTCACDHGWDWDSSALACIPKVYTCPAKPEEGAEWNTVSEYIQVWSHDHGDWMPLATTTYYSEEPDDQSCRYVCSPGYRFNGETCEPRPVCLTGSKFENVSALDLLHAMGICDFHDENHEGSFGIVPGSAKLGRANWPANSNSPDYRQYGIMTQFGTDGSNVPKFGDNMAVLSSGRARDESDPDPTQTVSYTYELGQPPNDFVAPHGGKLPVSHTGCPEGSGANDSVMLRVQLKVPEFAHAFSFDFRFFSQEYWRWTCTRFNDFFIAMLESEWTPENGGSGIPEDKNISFDSNGNYISVNSHQFFTVCRPKECEESDTYYDCPDGTSALSGTGYTASEAGATRWLTTTSPVVPEETITLRFIIWDTSDANFDSLVLLDNFRWHGEGTAGEGPGTRPSDVAASED